VTQHVVPGCLHASGGQDRTDYLLGEGRAPERRKSSGTEFALEHVGESILNLSTREAEVAKARRDFALAETLAHHRLDDVPGSRAVAGRTVKDVGSDALAYQFSVVGQRVIDGGDGELDRRGELLLFDLYLVDGLFVELWLDFGGDWFFEDGIGLGTSLFEVFGPAVLVES
jgi:hypothetical protein